MAKERNRSSESEPLAKTTNASSDEAEVRPRKGRRRERGVRLQEGSRIREPGTDPETEPFQKNSENGKTPFLGVTSPFNIMRKLSDKMASKKQGKLQFQTYLGSRGGMTKDGPPQKNFGTFCPTPV